MFHDPSETANSVHSCNVGDFTYQDPFYTAKDANLQFFSKGDGASNITPNAYISIAKNKIKKQWGIKRHVGSALPRSSIATIFHYLRFTPAEMSTNEKTN